MSQDVVQDGESNVGIESFVTMIIDRDVVSDGGQTCGLLSH